jgi:large subunit ribosomal protein L21
MSYAVIKTGGKQYRVQEGDVLEIEKLEVEAGEPTTFSEVLLTGSGDSVRVGTPLVEGASVEAKVVEQFRGDKVVAFKFKRRQGYHRTVGHRQSLTKVEITAIKA